MTAATGPLGHLTILDLSRLLPGGYCTLLLADLGADVIKVEQPGVGDYIRAMPPIERGVSAGHLALNRGKRSITLNLKTPEGVEVLKRLAAGADVLVESFRPGVLDRLGVGWDALRAVNERLIMCAITGYGQDGPYRDRAGHDINYLGYAGVLDIIGEADGPPIDPGVQIADIGGGGLMAATGILAAVAQRERIGTGSFVDIAMLDGAFSWLSFHGASYAMTGDVPERGGMRLSGRYACYRVYRCGDGRHLAVGALEPQFWARFCEVIDRPDLIERQFEEPNAPVIDEVVAILAAQPRAHWLDALEDLDACVGPIKDVGEAFHDAQLLDRGMVVPPSADVPWPTIGNPVRLGEHAQSVPTSRAGLLPPDLGEHTDEVLVAAGFDADEIERLRARGAL